MQNLWFAEAEERLKDAEAALKAGWYSASSFWSQQAAELSLKAVVLKGVMPPKVHDLVSLSKSANAPEHILDIARQLTPAYTESRYLDVVRGQPSKLFTEQVARKLLTAAKEVI